MNRKRIQLFICCLLLAAGLHTLAAAEALQLPAGLTEISAAAFENAMALEEVIIGKNVERIESRAFAGSSVKLVIFTEDSAIEYIAPDAFEGTEGVRFVTGGNKAAMEYIGTCGVTEYISDGPAPDEQNYVQTILLPVVPF